MSVPDLMGWIAVTAVLAAATMTTMLWLRGVAIISNVAFIAYAATVGLTPILVLHSLLLLVNTWRLYQMRQKVRAVRRANLRPDDLSWLPDGLPERRLGAGETLFEEGAPAHSMFVVEHGMLEVLGPDARIGPGGIVGEIGLFAPNATRGATVRAVENTTLLELEEARVRLLYYDNPEFAWRLVGLITRRMIENQRSQRRSAVEEGAAVIERDSGEQPR